MALDVDSASPTKQPAPPPPPPPPPAPAPTPTPVAQAQRDAVVDDASKTVSDRGRAGAVMTGATPTPTPTPSMPHVPAGASTQAVYEDTGLANAPETAKAAVTTQPTSQDRQATLHDLAGKAGVTLPPDGYVSTKLDSTNMAMRGNDITRSLSDQAQYGRLPKDGGTVRAAGTDVALTAQDTQQLTNPATRAQAAIALGQHAAQQASFTEAAGGKANADKIEAAYAALPQADKNNYTPPNPEPPSNDASLGNRIVGGLKVAGGVVEGLAAGALALAPEPTMLTKAGAVVVGAHAADTLQSGVRQMITGQSTPSFTQQGTAAAARALGASQETADAIGTGVDVGIGLASGLAGTVAARATAAAVEGVPQIGRAATLQVLRTETQTAGRAASVEKFGADWSKGSLEGAVDKLGAGTKVTTSQTGKVLYQSAAGDREVVQDAAGRYFRVRDVTNGTKRPYLGADGNPIPNNTINPATGKLRGMTQGEYNALTHFKME